MRAIRTSLQNVSNKITDLRDKHVLINKFSLKEVQSSNESWLTKGILKLINQKSAIYRKFIGDKNLHSKEIYLLELKQY